MGADRRSFYLIKWQIDEFYVHLTKKRALPMLALIRISAITR